ncbi:NUDIX hydrolase domain-like protein [Amylostereum chailletii]|nr:NUDIX hydrolase domain-like protein [Amylostereum chailletii]
MTDKILSFMDMVDLCDNFHISSSKAHDLIPFRASANGAALGLLFPSVVDALVSHNEYRGSQNLPVHWDIRRDLPIPSVSFVSEITTPAARTHAIHDTTTWWRDTGLFSNVISPKLWRGEWYAIYTDPFATLSLEGGDPLKEEENPNPNYVLSIERAASALFGVVTYGIHMTVYEEEDGEVRIWVPRRAATKQTWPGYLDNSIAGGIPARMSPRCSMVKESAEEGSLSETLVGQHSKAVGAVSYFYQTKNGWLQPEVEFVYDMRVPGSAHVKLSPGDNEVEAFKLMPLQEVIQHMHAGEFKPNCAVVLIDFLIRHGYITPDNEPHFLEIQTRLHGRFDHDRW